MSSVDQRIVRMDFQSAQFERGVKKSIFSLERLKQGLNLDNASKSLNRLQDAGRRFSLAGIASGVDAINAKFSALGVVGFTVMQNLTNSAMRAGERIVKALTIDPVKSGFKEYETKMNAIKTILANTQASGTTLADVNEGLAALNDYSDRTVYNFAQMTDMVGKFSAKTGEFKSSMYKVQGLANLAALSGVDNTRLQGALYQVSQIAETVKSLDWMSMDTAGLATIKFRTDLIAMAEKMGTVDAVTLNKLKTGSESFRDTLKEGWLTTGVFDEVTKIYALDEAMTKAAGEITTFTKLMIVMEETVQSGWAGTWEAIIGDKNQSMRFLSAISDGFTDIVTPAANARNELLQFWNDNGGRSALLIGLGQLLLNLGNVIAVIQKAWAHIFPPITGQRLIDLSEKFRQLTASLFVSEGTLNNIQKTFQGLFAALDVGKMIIKAAFKALFIGLQILSPVGTVIFFITGALGELLLAVRNIWKIFGVFSIDGFLAVIDLLRESINGALYKGIKHAGVALERYLSLWDKAPAFLQPIKGIVEKISNTLSKVNSSLSNFKPTFAIFGKSAYAAGEAGIDFKKTTDKITLSNVKMEDSLKGVINFFEYLKTGLKKTLIFIKPVTDGIGYMFVKLSEKTGQWLKTVTFEEIIHTIQTFITGSLFLALRRLANTLSKGLPKIMEAATNTLDSVRKSLEAYQNNLKSKMILNIAIALGILTAAIYVLSKIDPKALGVSLGAITIMLSALLGGFHFFAKIMDGKKFIAMGQLSIALISLSISMSLLASAMVKLQGLRWDQAAVGLATIITLMGALTVASIVLSRNSVSLTGISLGMMGLAGAIWSITQALEKAGKMEWEDLKQGLKAIAATIGMLTALTVLTTGTGFTGTATGILIFAGAMHILIGALAILGHMKTPTLQQGFISLAIALGLLVLSMKFLPVGLLGTAAGFIALAVAVNILISAVAIFGNIGVWTLVQGLAVIAVSLGILVLAMLGLSGVSGSLIAASTGIAILAVALTLLTVPLAIFGNMGIWTIVKGLGAIVVVLIALSVIASLIAPLSPVLLAVGASIGVMGAGLFLGATAISVFVAAMVALVAAAAATLAAIPVIGQAIRSFLEEVNKIIPALEDTGRLILKVIANLMPDIGRVVLAIVVMVVDIVIEGLLYLIEKVEEHEDRIYNAAEVLGRAIVLGVWAGVKGIFLAGFDIGEQLVEGIKSKWREITGVGEDTGTIMGEAILKGIDNSLEINSPPETIEDRTDLIADTFYESTKRNLPKLTKSGVAMGDHFRFGLESTTNTGAFSGLGMQSTGLFITGIKSTLPEVKESGKATAETFKEGVKETLGEDKGFWNFFQTIGSNVIKEGKAKMDEIISAPGKAIAKTVGSGSGLSKGINAAAKKVKTEFEKAMEWIEEEKYYERLTLQMEMDEYLRLQGIYAEGTEERKKLNREVFRVKKEMFKEEEASIKAIEKAEKDSYDARYRHSLDWIDDRKYYGELSLTEELAAWKRMQSRYYDELSEERMATDREVFRVQNQINKANEKFAKESLDIQKDTTETKIRLENEYYDKTKEINDKLKRDIKAVNDEYENSVKQRANSIYNAYKLFDAVEEKEAVDGNVLVTNLKGQVVQIDNWRKSLEELSLRGINEDLISELSQMGPESLQQIRALNRLSKPVLDEYVHLWQIKNEEAKDQATIELEGLRIESIKKIEHLTSDADRELTVYKETWLNQMGELKDDSITKLKDIRKEWGDNIGALRTDTERDFSLMMSKIQYELSRDLTSDLFKNVSSEIDKIKQKISTVDTNPIEVISRVDTKGFVSGLTEIKHKVGTGLSKVKDEVSNALSKLKIAVDNNMDLTPTIRPVIDLSSVISGVGAISSLVKSTSALSLTGSITQRAYESKKASSETKDSISPVKVINNEIKISNMNVREEADINKVSSALHQRIIATMRG